MGQQPEALHESAPWLNTVSGIHSEIEAALESAAEFARLSDADPGAEPDEGNIAERAADAIRRWAASVVGTAQSLLASDLSDAFNDLTQAAVDGPATIYDKAMDAEYLATHIGGGAHRLFDGGHTISGAYAAARDASTDDGLIEETLGTVQGLLRDVSTPMGLPLANWNKDTFDSVAESLHASFGIPKSWFADLVSYDAAELLGSTVGVVSMIFNWNKADTETFAQLAASMGLSAALSANPLLMPISLVALARAFHKARSGDGYADVADGAFRGTVASGASMGAVALVGVAGGPAGVALLAGISAAVLAHAVTKKVDLTDVHDFVRNDAGKVIEQFNEMVADAGKAVSKQAASAGRAAWVGLATTAELTSDAASAAGRFAADGAATAARSTASGAKRTGRFATRAADASIRSIRSAARRASKCVGRLGQRLRRKHLGT